MTTAALAAWTSTTLWAVLDVVRKRLAARMAPTTLVLWLNLGATPLFIAWAVWRGDGWPPVGWWAPAATSLVCTTAAQLLYVGALARGELGALVPLLAVTPALSGLMGWAATGEAPSLQRTLLILVIVAASVGHAWEGARFGRGTPAMFAVATLWSANSVIDRYALTMASPALQAATNAGATALVLGLWTWAREGRTAWKLPPRQAAALGSAVLLIAAAWGLQLLALRDLLSAELEGTKRGGGVVLSLVLGWLVFGERPTVRRTAVALVLALAVAGLTLAPP